MNVDLVMFRIQIPSGYSNKTVPFNHHRAEECLFVLEGTCHFQIGEDDAVVIASMTPPVF